MRFLSLATLFFAMTASAQMPFAFWTNPNKVDFVLEAEVAWTNGTSPKTTASFNVSAGDVLVAYAIQESDPYSVDISITGGNLAWIDVVTRDTNAGAYTELRMWKAVADETKSMTVSFSNGGAYTFGGDVLVFRKSAGIGGATASNAASGAPSVNITTTKANSAVVVANGDWSAIDGTTRSWRLNAIETSYARSATHYTIYGGYHANVGSAGTYAVGVSAPTGQKFTIGAVEVLAGPAATFCNGSSTPAIGTVCTDGSVFAGRSADTGEPMYTTPADAATTYVGNNGNTTGYVTTNLDSTTTGESNSDTLATLDSNSGVAGNQPHQAAQYCANLTAHGNSDWYLPASDELQMLYWNRVAIGGFGTGDYWSSTEYDNDEFKSLKFATGVMGSNQKQWPLSVRCVRK